MVTGCAGSRDILRQPTQAQNLVPATIVGERFRHKVLLSSGPFQPGRLIHVYIDGDGRPWIAERRVARDPTPRRSDVLPLMAQDPAWSVYLGRPCYHGLATEGPCSPWWWTHGRYGEAVVASMTAAIRALPQAREAGEFVLIGHSGGGTLAMLIAERLSGVRAVVTLAGNLDVARWSTHHRYSPLQGSLDPAQRDPLPAGLVQLHLVAGRDRTVPPLLVEDAIGAQPGAVTLAYPVFDHTCCWTRAWPAVLAELHRRLAGAAPVRRSAALPR